MNIYDKTHTLFKVAKVSKDTVWASEEADMCRQYLGENDPMQALQFRKWFTTFNGIYIRNDCLNNELVTWFALKDQA